MSKQYITEFVADKPLIVVCGIPSRLTKSIGEAVAAGGVQSVVVDLFSEQLSRSLLDAAYKVVWVNEEQDVESDFYQVAISQLIRAENKCVVIQPLKTAVKSPRNSADFGFEWAENSENLRNLILDINYRLPRASFIFGQDILDPANPALSPLDYALTKLQSGYIYDPDIDWRLQSAEDFARVAAELIFRPQNAGSYLVSSPPQGSTALLHQIRNKYEQYHSVAIMIQDKPQVEDESLPFSATQVEGNGINTDDLTKFVRALPTPAFADLPRVESVLKNELNKPVEPGAGLMADPVAKPEVEPNVAPPPTPAPTPTLQPIPSPPAKNAKKAVSLKKNKDIDVSDELQKIFSTTRATQRVSRINNKAKTEKKQRRKKKQRTALFWGGMASIVTASIVLILTAVFFTTQLLMKRSLLAVIIDASQVQASELVEKKSWENLVKINKAMALQTNAYSNLLSANMFSQANLLLQLTEQIEEMANSVDQTREMSKALVLQVLGIEGGDSIETAQKLQSQAVRTYENLSLLQAGLSQVKIDKDDIAVSDLFKQYETQVKEVRQGLATAQQIDPHLSELTGRNGKKTYALLLQNNQELRPTGGFIQAVALLSFDRGSLVSYQVFSSYELDDRFVGEVTPPEEITEYLNENNWFFRDSNWNPHFPDTARQTAWFLEKTTETKIDGVMGMNLLVMEDLIESLGPLEVEEYDELITHRNLQERMEFHSEVILVPENGKKDYGVIILEKMIGKMKNLQGQKVPGFLAALSQNLESQQLTITIFDENIQDTFSTLGWTGAIIEPQCPAQLSVADCHVDTIAQVEANVGVNKANFYLKRSVNHTISLGPEAAEHQRVVTFQNTAKTNSWPKGSYKSYVRFYLPEAAELSGIDLDGKNVPADKIKQYQESGKKVVGLLLEVPVDSTARLELNYSSPLSSETPFSYVFFNQKQSGTAETPITIKIVAPSRLMPALIAPQAEVSDNTIIFDDIQEKHSIVGVTYQ